jgi:two-component system, NarL family, sensor histidine kinase BarA
MSYRAFKHLLGETSLERKSIFYLGMLVVVLIAGSFYLYKTRTERLAYDQIRTACRLLVYQIIDRQLATGCRPPGADDGGGGRNEEAKRRLARALDEFQRNWDTNPNWKGGLDYRSQIIVPNSTKPAFKATDSYSIDRVNAFLADPDLAEDSQLLPARDKTYKYDNYYYAPIRATAGCLVCHAQIRQAERAQNPDLAELKDNDLLAVVKIEFPTKLIEDDVVWNGVWLMCTAFLTAVFIMIFSWMIIRYVIVKPVKHLKEVADAISAGELNVRSEIQTADEFEDLSHAFNRMLRNLVSMQDRLRKVNADLDRKVDELARANLALYESNRLKGDFLATMSHELRTPLNSILGFSEVLSSGDGLTEKQLRWVGNIRSSGEQLLALINDILDLAKIEAGKMEVRPSEFSVYDICEGLLTMFRPMAEKKNIDMRGILTPGMPLLRQDVVKFQQILSNLLSNAVKFTPEGGRVQLRAETDANQIVLTVSDTGVGIAADEQELIFEKFRQAGNPLTREHAGTGLGLSIVRELSKLMGGEVTLQSELGRGSTFTVRLPMQLSTGPRLEYDLTREGVDLSQAQRVDVRLYAGTPASDGR